ncbi:hypothetical protein ISF_00523 [Cordyceps fumosorosea ARSEF 2679]|uniref:Swiss Army Knife RNA repair protein HAD domain-containing protein n=1 Tax=Cordyceps fumosorosea (strain ARSEF 2679) TaxID=1081104 RepID=A0A162JTM6_CORFA|nr:hypothetical protein ISF_00523 [Cordyceps fumosorosea ARSEF 2679]OAA73622.1 hypothetical protein ISF_00523 [Cordyceps fumosorosea ARSEF 2679]
MAAASAFAHYNGAGQKRGQLTVTALGRWSSLNKTLPAVDKISALHVYDFDNTLFKTPLPNSSLWTGSTIGMLSRQDAFINSGWWHDNRILGATGLGLEREEARAWEGFWNEKIVELVRLTAQQPDALCVLLTGRGEQRFADLIRRIVASKRLDFDMLCLKPQVGPDHQKFSSTMKFKQALLTDLVETYRHADEIRIYEDRPAHTQGFRDFLNDYNDAQRAQPTRGPIRAEVIQVTDAQVALDPVVEVAQVQRMVNEHNAALQQQPPHLRPDALRIKKTVFFASYGIPRADADRLIALMPTIPTRPGDNSVRLHGTNIVIVPRPCPKPILAKVGGLGATMTWQVTGTACLQNSLWAACVTPVPATAPYHTDSPIPVVVLACKKGARPADAAKINTWSALPPERRFTFTTTVGEKAVLRVEADDPREDEYASLFASSNSNSYRGNKNNSGGSGGGRGGGGRGGGVRASTKRKHNDDDWNPPRQPAADAAAAANAGRGGRGGGRGGRGGAGSARGGRGGKNKGKGRGGFAHYRSLDDVGSRNPAPAEVNYDDTNAQPPANAPTGPRGGKGKNGGRGGGNHVTDLQSYY